MKALASIILFGMFNTIPFDRPEKKEDFNYPKMYALCPEDLNIFVDEPEEDND